MVSWHSSTNTSATYGDYTWGRDNFTVTRTKKVKKSKEKEATTLKKIEPVYFDPKDLYL